MIALSPIGSRSRGFTLIELMIVISIVAILMAIGIPSFQYVTSSNRASGEINGLLGDMQFARAEAIKEGQYVTICSSLDGLTCAGNTSWKTGWIVFSDAAPFGTVDANDILLKMQKAFSGTDSLVADQTTKFVTFNRDGFAMSLANPVKFTLTTTPVNARFTRCLSLSIVGAVGTQVSGGITAQGTAC